MMLDQLRRLLCRVLSHKWHGEMAGEPVVPLFLVCTRCGKWERSR